MTNKQVFAESSISKEITLEKPYRNAYITKDASRKLDFLILAIETLQINAMDTVFERAKNMGLADDYSCRVRMWKIRCLNPMRKSYNIGSMTADQVDSLVKLISSMADYLYPLIRQLLSSKESEKINNERWNLFSSRLKSLIKERMNTQRGYITSLVQDRGNEFFRELLVILSLSSGPGGTSRLKASLYQTN